ncbi:Uncharacterized protein OBRU01_08134 [Operophtera brumata]|uniref:Uncharacterized protein n=1 Tax=Operophtera brumata TaxID=104452 RepID=A0A0L7LI46_OPEBR|nr:Uncharacterized protein OBRU01_08134 [Operophtera brumata]
MPALWQSSQRPMYIRTVWVDGFRHAILTQDDPYLLKLAKRRRPNSSSSFSSTKNTNSRLSHHEDKNQRKLDLVVKSGKSIITKRPKSSHEEVEKLNLSDIDQDSDEELMVKASPQVLNESGRHIIDMNNYRANKTARTDTKENTELSNRVLQWLDLAGKVDLLAPGNNERLAQPRHSWPEIQRRHNLLKSKTALDIRVKEAKMYSPKACDSPKAQQNIDRHDFYVPTSANTIEKYARQSRNIKITPQNENQPQPKARENNKIKPRETKPNVTETRQKVASERNAVQKQYAELVSKKLIPDVSKNTKKQVHIFIPDMPKKPTANISATTSRAESLLSHQSLKLLRQ